MDFIFMLTRGDRTVEDALAVLELISPLGIRHVGFKDVGVAPDILTKIAEGIRKSGATSYLEVVSTTPEDCLRSARIGRELGVDRLLGGTQVDEILDILGGSRTQYFPFTGRPLGHPTRLAGTPEDVETQARTFTAKGCPGVDLLAYRSTESDPLELISASRRGLGPSGYLIVAGSVNSASQIKALRTAGADAFTVGSAVFDGSFSPNKGSPLSQLEDILQACANLD